MAAWLSSLVEASCTLGPQTPRRDSLVYREGGRPFATLPQPPPLPGPNELHTPAVCARG
jgi:hypothetical protein